MTIDATPERSADSAPGALDRLRDMRERSLEAGGQKRIDAQHAKGKMTARERVDFLLDEGSFVELDRYVTHRCTNFDMEDQKILGDGVVTGYGRIEIGRAHV